MTLKQLSLFEEIPVNDNDDEIEIKKDYTGNSKTAFVCNGCSNHSEEQRELFDYYATPPGATEELLKKEKFATKILEPCVGGGHIAQVLKNNGYEVESRDLINRGYPGTVIQDFLINPDEKIEADIVTNPPYKLVIDFWRESCKKITEGHKIAFFLKLTFLEGQERKKLFEQYPPSKIYVFSYRIAPAKNGDFGKYGDSAIAYAWFIYEKGNKAAPSVFWI